MLDHGTDRRLITGGPAGCYDGNASFYVCEQFNGRSTR